MRITFTPEFLDGLFVWVIYVLGIFNGWLWTYFWYKEGGRKK